MLTPSHKITTTNEAPKAPLSRQARRQQERVAATMLAQIDRVDWLRGCHARAAMRQREEVIHLYRQLPIMGA
jgi:hypothetical protein